MHKNILIATDGTDASTRAISEGLDLAGEYGARVIGVYIVDIDAFNIMDIDPEDLERRKNTQIELGKGALDSLERLASLYRVDVEKVLREGEPAKEVLNIAKEYGADLIVAGTHGRKGFKKLLCRRVSDSFIKDAQYPLLV